MKNQMMSVAAASQLIQQGATCMIYGALGSLQALPRGAWLGIETPFFMTTQGKLEDDTQVLLSQLSHVTNVRCCHWPTEVLHRLAEPRFDHGVTLLGMPVLSAAHMRYGTEGAAFDRLYDQPTLGAVSGSGWGNVQASPRHAVDGLTGTFHAEGAVALYVQLSEEVSPWLDVLNTFDPDPASPEITFDERTFLVGHARVDGEQVWFTDWLEEAGETRARPLVVDYAGTTVNMVLGAVKADRRLSVGIATQPGLSYRFGLPVPEEDVSDDPAIGIGSIRAYMSDLLVKDPRLLPLPAAFGQIAYIPMSQTVVRLSLLPR